MSQTHLLKKVYFMTLRITYIKLFAFTHVYTYIYILTKHTYTDTEIRYIYIYIYREREREREIRNVGLEENGEDKMFRESN